MHKFETIAKQSATIRREGIKLIPDNCEVSPQHLGTMTNSEFIAAFGEMQNLIIAIYTDVEKAPFKWGYPETNHTENLYSVSYNRISDFFMFVTDNGSCSNGVLSVQMKDFVSDMRKKHKDYDLLVEKLTAFGFRFCNFEKKADIFTLSYPQNPSVIEALSIYAQATDRSVIHIWTQHAYFASFSYRWVEVPQKHEPVFLVCMDKSSAELQNVQYWLYDKARGYGFAVDKNKPTDKGCINYTKSSKQLFPLGENNDSGKPVVYAKIIFRKVLGDEEIFSKLRSAFPRSFGIESRLDNPSGCEQCKEGCTMRIDYEIGGAKYNNCAYLSFYFRNITMENIGILFDAYRVEYKIK